MVALKGKERTLHREVTEYFRKPAATGKSDMLVEYVEYVEDDGGHRRHGRRTTVVAPTPVASASFRPGYGAYDNNGDPGNLRRIDRQADDRASLLHFEHPSGYPGILPVRSASTGRMRIRFSGY